MGQVEVLVKHKQTGEERTMTYHSFKDLTSSFDLIGQCDSAGNLIPGDPNLDPRHQKVQARDVAVHAVDSGMSLEDKQMAKDELMKKFIKPIEVKPVIESEGRSKPGPKPKAKESA